VRKKERRDETQFTKGNVAAAVEVSGKRKDRMKLSLPPKFLLERKRRWRLKAERV
jgi:hypothetical protein